MSSYSGFYEVYDCMTTMTDSDTQDKKPQDYLLIVHDRVPGRTRINVPGLYRNDLLRASLESSLTVLDEIRLVRANTLTGNLLVEYTALPGTYEMPAGIAQLLEAELGCPIIRRTQSIDRPLPKKVVEHKLKKPGVDQKLQAIKLSRYSNGTCFQALKSSISSREAKTA